MEIIERQTAINLGRNRYFTGTPCKRNHLSERYTLNSACIECLHPGSNTQRQPSIITQEKLSLEKKRLELKDRALSIKEKELDVRLVNAKTREQNGTFAVRQAEERTTNRNITAVRKQSKAEMKEIHLMMRDPSRLLDLKMAAWGTAVMRVPTLVLADVFVRTRHDAIHTVRCFVEDQSALIEVAKELERNFEVRLSQEIEARKQAIAAAPVDPEDEEYERKFPEGDPR